MTREDGEPLLADHLTTGRDAVVFHAPTKRASTDEFSRRSGLGLYSWAFDPHQGEQTREGVLMRFLLD